MGSSAYAQGAILTADGQLTLYDPLVIDTGTQLAQHPPPRRFGRATVALWFGFNGTNLTLQAAKRRIAGGGQLRQRPRRYALRPIAYCNAGAFFQLANSEIAANKLQVPGVETPRTPAMPDRTDFSLSTRISLTT